MSERRGLVLDANILLRAVFGQRVRQILEKHEDKARFYTPDLRFEDARRYIPHISNERGLDVDLGLSVLEQIGRIVEIVDRSLYEESQPTAASVGAIRTIGQLWLRRCCSICRFGRKIRISLAAASRHGRAIGLNSIWMSNHEKANP